MGIILGVLLLIAAVLMFRHGCLVGTILFILALLFINGIGLALIESLGGPDGNPATPTTTTR